MYSAFLSVLRISMKRFLLVIPLLLVTFLPRPGIASARVPTRAHAFPVTITDDHGNRVRLTSAPKHIVSLDPRDTETLFALGLESRVVGDGSKYAEGATGVTDAAGKPRAFKYPSEWPSKWGRDYPIRSLALPHVEGGCCGVDFNLETITSLQPDLVLAPYSQTELPVFQKLRDLGMKVIILDPSTVKGILHDISLVGKATGSSKHAATVVAAMKHQLSALRTRVAKVRTHPRVYYEIDATNKTQPYTAGPGTFIDEGIRLVGGRNVADGVTSCSGTTCYPQFSLEALVQLNPQVIVLGDAAYGTSPAEVKSRAGWETMSAIKTGKIYPFDDSLISRAGPRIIIGLTKIARLVHPELFRRT